MNQKNTLRKQVRQSLAGTPTPSLARASQTICLHLQRHWQDRPLPTHLAVFAAHGAEIDLSSLHHLLPQSELLYPLCHAGGILSFHKVDRFEELAPGMLGILEPRPDIHPEIPIGQINCFLCPGLAFGEDGTRLGHGGGYYDRALSRKSPDSTSFGIALASQIQASVPHDAHDIRVDHIVTEVGIVQSKPSD
ncbi:5-formyltetrahydrofolate cyclo-ligase [Verrucomicrobiaceae bacterium N1E253]|uniref:5-formyltetrahydrofolate cyclo-ligase n=1 Tax=Oceaniferula marina TaxID=2748318 RepID=A0A851G9Q1_9BACT|nr:5-formyltetrahydrofolate cyclo-ligase [Oceaniferula marina]NWK54333.1 5-formyltetrahydrofolate cyclo-ligase [Oceaniferula marina]